MDTRRLKLLPLAVYRLRYLWHWLARRRDFRNAYSYVWASLFSRDAGLALLDPLIRRAHWLARYPKQVEIEVTTRCNLRCAICEHSYWNEPGRDMSFDEFRHIVDQFPKLHWIGLTGIGSSFLNKDYMKMVRYMKQERHSFVEFFDHFNQFDETIARECIELGVNKIWVSLENARADSYNAYRKGGDFDQVLKNLWALVRLKKEMRSPIPELWFHFIINRHNASEMKEYVDLVAKVAEFERGFSAPLIYWTNLLAFEEVSDWAIRPGREWLDEVQAYCAEKRVFSVFNENVACTHPMRHCAHWTEPFVLVTGHIQPCCALNEANTREWQKEHAFANLLETDFRDWWRSPARKAFQETIRRGGINDICRYCHIYPHPDSARFRASGATPAKEH